MRGGRLDTQVGAEARGDARPNLCNEAGCSAIIMQCYHSWCQWLPAHLDTLFASHLQLGLCPHLVKLLGFTKGGGEINIYSELCRGGDVQVWGVSEGGRAGLCGRVGQSHTFPPIPSDPALLLPGCPLFSCLPPHLSLFPSPHQALLTAIPGGMGVGEALALRIGRDVLTGLHTLHSNGLVYGDMKVWAAVLTPSSLRLAFPSSFLSHPSVAALQRLHWRQRVTARVQDRRLRDDAGGGQAALALLCR